MEGGAARRSVLSYQASLERQLQESRTAQRKAQRQRDKLRKMRNAAAAAAAAAGGSAAPLCSLPSVTSIAEVNTGVSVERLKQLAALNDAYLGARAQAEARARVQQGGRGLQRNRNSSLRRVGSDAAAAAAVVASLVAAEESSLCGSVADLTVDKFQSYLQEKRREAQSENRMPPPIGSTLREGRDEGGDEGRDADSDAAAVARGEQVIGRYLEKLERMEEDAAARRRAGRRMSVSVEPTIGRPAVRRTSRSPSPPPPLQQQQSPGATRRRTTGYLEQLASLPVGASPSSSPLPRDAGGFMAADLAAERSRREALARITSDDLPTAYRAQSTSPAAFRRDAAAAVAALAAQLRPSRLHAAASQGDKLMPSLLPPPSGAIGPATSPPHSALAPSSSSSSYLIPTTASSLAHRALGASPEATDSFYQQAPPSEAAAAAAASGATSSVAASTAAAVAGAASRRVTWHHMPRLPLAAEQQPGYAGNGSPRGSKPTDHRLPAVSVTTRRLTSPQPHPASGPPSPSFFAHPASRQQPSQSHSPSAAHKLPSPRGHAAAVGHDASNGAADAVGGGGAQAVVVMVPAAASPLAARGGQLAVLGRRSPLPGDAAAGAAAAVTARGSRRASPTRAKGGGSSPDALGAVGNLAALRIVCRPDPLA